MKERQEGTGRLVYDKASRRIVTVPSKTIRWPCRACNGVGVHVVANGAYLRLLRLKAGLTLRECARAWGVSAPYLSDIELGNRRPTDKLTRLYYKLAPDETEGKLSITS